MFERREPVCRNIKTLFNFEPPATEAEVRAAALQFVRKLSGFNQPSLANEAAFVRAVDEVAATARTLRTPWSPTRRHATVRWRHRRRGSAGACVSRQPNECQAERIGLLQLRP